jgi:molybdate transport system substrate-binding protein
LFGRRLFFVLLLTAAACFAQEKRLTIAAAADLGPAFKEVAAGFEKQSGVKVRVILGSSGNFFAQIQNGAPYDLFFSADRDYAKKLQDRGLADQLTTYAEGSIVLWVRNDSKLDLARGMDVLLDPSIKTIAIGNPAHAPYGKAALSALEHFGLADKVRSKLVFGENISQATQFVETGNADVGITALSLALSPALRREGRYSEIPHDAYPRMEQAAVILKSAANREAATAFLSYLESATAKEIMQRYGFRMPQAAGKK